MSNQEKKFLLNTGKLETKNLMEALSIDFNILIPSVLPEFKEFTINNSLGITKKMLLTAQLIYQKNQFTLFDFLKTHNSDTVRGIACFLIAQTSQPFNEKLTLIYDLANDSHFGVREWAWLCLREEIIKNPHQGIKNLLPWAHNSKENIRRFACEITRPRGVWCSHIKELKKEPWQALSLLEKLKDDPSRYVQLSVGNWLNDAGKDHPEWVKSLCTQWILSSHTENTSKICKRALRNIKV
ncbi:MAG: DNA alkylation repair protein [Candidatus Dependentiae bacterium]